MAAWFAVDKDPHAILDYAIDWGPTGEDWLQGDTISAASWTAQNGITMGNGANGAPAPSFTTVASKVWLIGGKALAEYLITVHVTTLAGRQDDRSILVRMLER